MSDIVRDELKLLTRKRWDLRKGVPKWLGTAEWILGVVLAIFVFLSCFMGPTIGFSIPIYYGPLALLAICWMIPKGIQKKTSKRAHDADWFLCVWCRYDLTGMPSRGTCPECGELYDELSCRTLYECAYRSNKPDRMILERKESQAWRKAVHVKYGIDDSDESIAADLPV
jgi:hypothetical protein